MKINSKGPGLTHAGSCCLFDIKLLETLNLQFNSFLLLYELVETHYFISFNSPWYPTIKHLCISQSSIHLYISDFKSTIQSCFLLFPLYFLASSLNSNRKEIEVAWLPNYKVACMCCQAWQYLLTASYMKILYETWCYTVPTPDIKLLTRNKGSSIVLFKGSHVYLLFNLLQ